MSQSSAYAPIVQVRKTLKRRKLSLKRVPATHLKKP